METKIEIIKIFNNLNTAPDGAVIAYKLYYANRRNEKYSTVLIAFDDGYSEVVWGAGTHLIDALKVASREYLHIFGGSSMEKENPFQEALSTLENQNIANTY